MKHCAALQALMLAVVSLAARLAAEEPSVPPRPTIAVGSTVVAAQEGARLHLKDKQIARLEPGTRLVVARIEGKWIGVYDDSTGTRRAGWIQRDEIALAEAAPAVDAQPGLDSPEQRAAMEALTKLKVKLEVTFDGVLESADARNLDLSNDDLAHFEPLVQLEEIDLSGAPIGDKGLAHLKSLKNLRRLYLSKTAVTDEGLAQLAALSSLQVLALDDTQVLGPGLEHLKGLTDLRALNLSNCPVDDESLEPLEQFTLMETLALEKTNVHGDGLVHLKPMAGLHVLNLNGCSITDEDAFANLEGLEELRIIRLYDAEAPEKGLTELKRALPSLAIFR